MATIVDPDDLSISSQDATGTPTGEVYINTANKTIELISTDDYAGNLIPADGVTLQALYSFLKIEWKNDSGALDLIQYEFPMEAITPEQFEFKNGWKLDDTNTASRTYIRTGGWVERDTAGDIGRGYIGAITLGNIESNHTSYYYWASEGGGVTHDFNYQGPVNEAIQYYGDISVDATTTTFNYTNSELTLYIRSTPEGTSGNVTGFTFDSSDTTSIGVDTAIGVTYQVYRFPLAEAIDLNISLTDAEVASLISSNGLTISWNGPYTSSTYFTPDLVGGPYTMEVRVDSGTVDSSTNEIYNFSQYQLRQSGDIDDSATEVNYGKVTPELLKFVGSELQSIDFDTSGTAGGVIITGFDNTYVNDIAMSANDGTLANFPYTATGKISFNNNLIEDAASKYWMYTDTSWPGAGATFVQKADNATDITGDLHFQTTTPTTGNATGTTGTVTASGTTLTVSGETWTVDDFIGKVLVVTGGTTSDNNGYYWIVSNTSTTLTVNRAFEASDTTSVEFTIRNKNTSGEINWDYDWTGNGDVAVVVIGMGLNNAQYVQASNNIVQAVGQNFSLVSALERNYNDPV